LFAGQAIRQDSSSHHQPFYSVQLKCQFHFVGISSVIPSISLKNVNPFGLSFPFQGPAQAIKPSLGLALIHPLS